MSRSDNNVELLITLVKNNQQCLQGFRVEIVNHFIIISTLWIHSEDTGWIFNLKSCWGLRQAPLCKRKMFFHGFRRVMLWYCRYVMEWFVVSMPLIEGIRPDVGAKQGLHFSPTLKHYRYILFPPSVVSDCGSDSDCLTRNNISVNSVLEGWNIRVDCSVVHSLLINSKFTSE